MTLRWQRAGWQQAGRVYLVAIVVLALAPAGLIVVDSFNSATSFPSPFEHLTFHWYAAAFARDEFVSGLAVSLEVAVLAASASTAVAFLAAYALSRAPMRGGTAIATALMGPLFMPEVVLSLATLQLVNVARLPLTTFTLVAAHAVHVMPFALRLVLAGFSRVDFSLEDAARSLGARRWKAIWTVTIPLVRPSLIAGFTLAAIMSFVNLPLSLFLTTARNQTLPVAVSAFIESRIDPTVCAVAAVVAAVAAVASVAVDRLLRIRLVG